MLTPRQRAIVRILLIHYRHQPEGPGMTLGDITEALVDNPGAVREAMRTLAANLAASDVTFRLRSEVDPILRLRPMRYRLVQLPWTSESGTAPEPDPVTFKADLEKAFAHQRHHLHHLADLPTAS